ncbi:S8 family serine peptidase [Synergistaceae bacterium OttesenSCG-928-I11]|nr:S8 family serine peptidase [Synergistaceae bacterium OttesenSCG-928-I11]
MKKISIKSLLLLFVFSLVIASPAFAETGQYVPGEALVVIADPVAARSARSAEDRAAALAVSVRAQADTTYTALSEAGGNVFALIRSESQSTEALIEALKNDPDVLAASPNWIIRAHAAPNDPNYLDGKLWGMTRIGAEAAWDITSGDETVYVAVLDTGIQGDHEDLAANVDLTLARNFATSDPAKSRDVADGDGHGTHVSGTIGAVGNNAKGVVGVNWRVKLIPLKVLGDDGSGNTSMLLSAVNYIVELLQKDGNMKIAAVNFSGGGYRNTTPANIQNSADWIAFKALDSLNRTVIVFAAGNESAEADAPLTANAHDSKGNVVGTPGQYNYPTAYTGIDNMIVVGAINRGDIAATFTNWSGRSVHLVAPGVDIYSTTKEGTYISESGTSMAAPHVSGAVALLAAQHPEWKAHQIKARLLGTADTSVNPIFATSIEPQFVPDRTVSAYGLLRIDRALDTSVATRDVRATQARLSVPSTKMRVDETKTVTATILPYNTTNKNVTWSSSDNAIVTVDNRGVIRAISKGTATITATAVDGSGAIGSITIEATSLWDDITGGGGGGCSALTGVLPLVAAAAFLATRRRVRAK